MNWFRFIHLDSEGQEVTQLINLDLVESITFSSKHANVRAGKNALHGDLAESFRAAIEAHLSTSRRG